MTPSWRRCVGAMRASTEALLGRLMQAVEDELEAAVELRHRLHSAPELAHADERTAAAVAEQMPVQRTPAACMGRIARIGSDAVAAVGVRAELDGLPVRER